jgi:cytokinin riboside 5'-monophosphate phosphoribohydrolase
MRTVCVYASSSDALAPVYQEAARDLGIEIGRRGLTLVYGAGHIGLMGITARAVHEAGGKVVGVIPDMLHERELSYEDSDELIITGGMRERKAIMEDRADAFIALPGGFGTFEEILEVVTLKQLHYHQKPICFFNVNNFYTPLLECFEQLFTQKFTQEQHRNLYHAADSVSGVFDFLDAYQHVEPIDKWFKKP